MINQQKIKAGVALKRFIFELFDQILSIFRIYFYF